MKRFMIAVAAVLVLAAGAVGIGAATTSAQEGDGPIGSFLAKVADKLGVSEDELKTAIQDARNETIDEALAEGRITADQAERLRERAAESDRLLPGLRHRFGVCRGAGLVVEAAAQVLDTPVGQVVEALKQGQSLAELAEAEGMSVEEFTPSLLREIQTQLDEMVAAEKLTREQADRIFEKIEENIDRIVNGHVRPHGRCRHGDGPRPHDRAETDAPSDVTA